MLAMISKQFRTFAKNECKNSSPLYEHLAYQIADDEELLLIAKDGANGQPVPNLLFAAVHYLLLTYMDDDLADFYPSLTTTPKPLDSVYPFFKKFVLFHAHEVKTILQERLVQTNEIRRCAYLYPMMTEIYQNHRMPLAFIEIGTSAGLQLAMDQYNYCYNQTLSVYNSATKLVLTSENIGDALPPSLSQPLIVSQRIGIDLNPMDVTNEQDVAWLQALIWPEHHERRTLLNTAIPILQQVKIALVRGDAIEGLKDISSQIDPQSMLVVYHTHVANQIPLTLRHALIDRLKDISLERPLYHCYNNLFDLKLHQDFLHEGEIKSIRTIDQPDGHARWFKWVNE
ncbi:MULTISPECIES: DUF2332 domain-containing protein [unclassified Lysinibacillus]|uniref:DUF2332 domain-containing protein n=1 Tax=unclassified Lysinibacillus TaxID=2636778 RepID=UPI00381EED5C